MKTLAVLYRDLDGVFRKYPFKHEYTFRAYAHFAEMARSRGLHVVFARPEWYSAGKLRLSWSLLPRRLEKNIWPDFVFDRCLSRDGKTNEFLQNLRKRIKKRIGILNDPFIEDVCNDKAMTYNYFGRWMPKTVSAMKSINSITSDLIVIKPRFGAGGKHVRVVNKISVRRLDKDFLLQEFVDTSSGINGQLQGVHDLRVVISNGRIIDFYARVPKKGLISNISMGGRLVRIKHLPAKAREICSIVDKKLEKFKPRFYSVDFLFDSCGPRVVELNSHPTLDVYYEIPGQKKNYDRICSSLLSSISERLK